MDRLNEVKQLVKTGFRLSPQWIDWYFDKVYDDNFAMTVVCSSQTVSCLLLDRYKLKLGAREIDMAYLSCATTKRQARGNGHMRRLLSDALMEAASRGDAMVSLIPASTRLYSYYSRLGFTTVFYADVQRYTSLHHFEADPTLDEVDADYDDFHALELSHRCRVLHSRRDFENILADNALDSGYVIAVRGASDSNRCAMLFAVNEDEHIRVKDLLASDASSCQTALAKLRHKAGEKMIVVDSEPGETPAGLCSRGMTRIVDVAGLLSALVAGRPDISQVIKVRDPLIAANNNTFIIHDGHIERSSATMRRPTIDVTIDVLARIIFNSTEIGNIFGLPSFRPSMSLMLE